MICHYPHGLEFKATYLSYLLAEQPAFDMVN